MYEYDLIIGFELFDVVSAGSVDKSWLSSFKDLLRNENLVFFSCFSCFPCPCFSCPCFSCLSCFSCPCFSCFSCPVWEDILENIELSQMLCLPCKMFIVVVASNVVFKTRKNVHILSIDGTTQCCYNLPPWSSGNLPIQHTCTVATQHNKIEKSCCYCCTTQAGNHRFNQICPTSIFLSCALN